MASTPHGRWWLLLCLLPALGLAGGARAVLERRAPAPATRLQEVLLVPPGEMLRQLDLGYHSLAADLLFIQANLYYGEHMLSDEELPWMDEFLDVLMALDPDFKKIYLWGALVTIYYKREIDVLPESLVERANAILRRGQERFPDDYQFPMRIGFNLYYELGDPEKAVPYFERAAGLPGAPEGLREKLVDLYDKRGQRELAVSVLQELISQTDEPVLDQALRDRLLHLVGRDERARLERARKRLVERWQAEYDYIPLELYLLVRDAPMEAPVP